ncbi:hypothetical protein ACTMTJ_42405 [Phytohabitans sp. LJ34]|uniref:hypothetical protein n=1 Tax=Phytohabitans sp. LJ34 TaxID=3452217 RepID=UPI003F8CEAE5
MTTGISTRAVIGVSLSTVPHRDHSRLLGCASIGVVIHKVTATVLVSAVLAAGCSSGQSTDGRPPSSPATSPTATPATAVDLLKSGLTFIDQVSFRADMAIGESIAATSRTDNANKRATATLSAPGGKKLEIRAVGDDLYMMAAGVLPDMPKGWMVVDPAKVPAAFGLSFAQGSVDPGGSARLVNAVTSARATGSDISGTIDIGKIGVGNGMSFPGVRPGEVQGQFQATLDDQGRLTSFAIHGEGVPSGSVRYSEFGTPVAVSAPQGAVPAPESLYPLLGVQ